MFKYLSYSGIFGILFLIIILSLQFDFDMSLEQISDYWTENKSYPVTMFFKNSISFFLAFLPIYSHNQLIFLAISFLFISFFYWLPIIILSVGLLLFLLKVACSIVGEIIKLMRI